jgi:hypothetical protein
MTTRCIVSERRGLEMAAWARIVNGALKREANSAFWNGEIDRATSFLPLITYTEQQGETGTIEMD